MRGLAPFLVILLLASACTSFTASTQGGGESEAAGQTVDPIVTVEALFDARNQGDFDTYIGLLSDEAIQILGNGIVSRVEQVGLSHEAAARVLKDDLMFWYVTGTEWILSDCQSSPSGSRPGYVVTCRLIANTGLLQAWGEPARPTVVRYVVENATITLGPLGLIDQVRNAHAHASFNEWVEARLEDGGIEEGAVPCDTTFAYIPPLEGGHPLPTVDCAQWIADHLDQWAVDLEVVPNTGS